MRQLLEEKGLMALPVGFRRDTKKVVALGEVYDDLDSLLPHDTLDLAQRKELVVKRWQAGSWEDIYACDELITLARANSEIENNTPIGQTLMRIELRAIEMMLEDITKSQRSRRSDHVD